MMVARDETKTSFKQDLSLLVWVIDELKKTLNLIIETLKKNINTKDANKFDLVRQQIHQCSGVLNMVGQSQIMPFLNGMDEVIKFCASEPNKFNEDLINSLEQANYALLDYLQIVLSNNDVSPVALFPQYRDIFRIIGQETKVSPTDLFPPIRQQLKEPIISEKVEELDYTPEIRKEFEKAILNFVKTSDLNSAKKVRDLCLGLAQNEQGVLPRTIWKITAGFCDALFNKSLNLDIYTKRMFGRILSLYICLSRSDEAIQSKFLQDIIFFCIQSKSNENSKILNSVKEVLGVIAKPVDYEKPSFGLINPQVLANLQKKFEILNETWSDLVDGNIQRADDFLLQFGEISQILSELEPELNNLLKVLSGILQQINKDNVVPKPELAMEVATTILYLQSYFNSVDRNSENLIENAKVLSSRLTDVLDGKEAQELLPWMRELYRQASDKEIMGSITGELRTTLAEAEQSLNHFTINKNKQNLQEISGQFIKIQGVLAVLGLNDVSLAIEKMSKDIDRIKNNEIAESEYEVLFDRFGRNLGTLGFLIDMLGYQRNLAQYVYDYNQETGELSLKATKTKLREFEILPNEIIKETEKVEEEIKTIEDFESFEQLEDAKDNFDFIQNKEELEVDPLIVPELLNENFLTNKNEFELEDNLEDNDINLFNKFNNELNNFPDSLDSFNLSEEIENKESVGNFIEDKNIQIQQVEKVNLEETIQVNKAEDLSFNQFEEFFKNTELTDKEELENLKEEIKEEEEEKESVADFLKSTNNLDNLQKHEEDSVETVYLNNFLDEENLSKTEKSKVEEIEEFKEIDDLIEFKVNEELKINDEEILLNQFFRNTLVSQEEDEEEQQNAELTAELELEQELLKEVSELEFPEKVEEIEVIEEKLQEKLPQVTEISNEDVDEEILEIFLEEAKEVFSNCQELFKSLRQNPQNKEAQTDLRRAYHTLKGSSRMVGLNNFGEAAWSLEQVMNEFLPHDQAMTSQMLEFCSKSFDCLSEWVDAIANKQADNWNYEPIKISADALRLENKFIEIDCAKVRGQLNFTKKEEKESNKDVTIADSFTSKPETITTESGLLTEEDNIFDIPEYLDLNSEYKNSNFNILDDADEEYLQSLVGELENEFKPSDLSNSEKQNNLSSFKMTNYDLENLEENFDLHDFKIEDINDTNLEDILDLTSNNKLELSTETIKEFDKFEKIKKEEIKEVEIKQTKLSPLLEVYFPEAITWSEKLKVTFSNWQINKDVPQDAVIYSHSLAGSSATVGFKQLSEFARALEHSLLHLQQNKISINNDWHKTFVLVSDEIIQGLAKLKEGQIVEFSEDLLTKLKEIKNFEVNKADKEKVKDEINPDLFTIFEEEARDLLPKISSSLREWSQNPSNLQARVILLRALHTLKGSARLTGAMGLGEMAHKFESTIEALGTENIDVSDLKSLLSRVDEIDNRFNEIKNQQNKEINNQENLENKTTSKLTNLTQVQNIANQQTIRVRSNLVDYLINGIGDVLISRSKIAKNIDNLQIAFDNQDSNLERLSSQLRELEVQVESQMQTQVQHSKNSGIDFDPLEFDRFTRTQELTRLMAEVVGDISTVQKNIQLELISAESSLIDQASQTKELQRDLLRTRMVEFETIEERLHSVVRMTANETGKNVELILGAGKEISIDRSVLERMIPAFEHLLRNCVDHGIETETKRLELGKDLTGQIKIELHQDGNDVSITIKDDGAGLNLKKIRAKAVEQGLLTEKDLDNETRAAQIIFMPGFTTTKNLTSISGRGVGMDVVRSEVQALGGSISVQTKENEGSSFTLILPLTTAVTQIVIIRIGDFIVGVPASLVELIRRVNLFELEPAYRSGTISFLNERIPFYWAGTIWKQSKSSINNEINTANKMRTVLICKSATQRIAIHIDEIIGRQEVVVKNMGPQLMRLPGLTGISILPETGEIILIYNPVAITTVYTPQIKDFIQTKAVVEDVETTKRNKTDLAPLIMAVDDSITVRRVTQRFLQREGFRVLLANDGEQALKLLETGDELPKVILSDIEMPKMDGLELLKSIRNNLNNDLAKLPVIMITSRMASKHSDLAKQLGANDYLGKPYSEEQLLTLLTTYINKV